MITVSIPTYRTPPELLRRAVRSVLDQTYEDVRVFVVGDGEPADLRDERVTVHTLRENRGRYFIDALVLAVTDTEFWVPHDSDDWSEPDRFERHVEEIGDRGVLWAPYWHHPIRGEPYLRVPSPKPGELKYFAHHCAGLYRTEAVRSVGGPHPEFRGSGDTLMMSLLETHTRTCVSEHPGYHHEKRAGSLSKNPETALGTPWRKQQQKLQRRVWAAKQADWSTNPYVSKVTRRALAEETERLMEVL